MTASDHADHADYRHATTNPALFRERVAAARRQAGHLQKELADALNIDPQVLSRKLHTAKQAFLTHAEIKLIVKMLATWDAITTQAEACELLSLMGLKPDSFSSQEWHTPPLDRLESAKHIHAADPVSSVPVVSYTLPASPTSLIGREYHVQLLRDRLLQSSTRLLTLRGTGGVGKTRLALEVARTVKQDFAAGVFFVPLATLHDASLVPSTLVQALHLEEPFVGSNERNVSSPEELLKDFLRDKDLLLVLDNVEQIPEIATFISELLNASATLKMMLTSRAVLRLYGEHEFEVPPLDVDRPDHMADFTSNSEHSAQFPAVRLFVERARAVNPTFQPTPSHVATIAAICARLDGLPLAIELAAARTKTFSLATILQRLTSERGQSLTFLRSTARDISRRHHTLHETLDWSYELLDPEQQRLFRRLSIFLGGWTLQAARAIALDEPQAFTLDAMLEQIESLLDHSLVKQLPYAEGSDLNDQEPRFYFLETIREYGLEHLEASGERTPIQKRHAQYYLALAEDVEAELSDRTQSRALSILEMEQDNLRAALSWALSHDEVETVQRLSSALSRYWEARTSFREAHRWIDAALALPQETQPAIRAKLLMAASRIALWEVAYERSRELAQEALSLYAALDDTTGKTWAIFQIADTWYMQGEYTLAMSYFEKSLPLMHEQTDWRGYAFTLSRLGAMATLQGNFSQAWSWLNEALVLLREYSEPALLNVTLIYLGVLALLQGNPAQSTAYFREGLLFAQETNNHYMLATDLIAFGGLLGITHAPSYAARICSAAEALFERLHTALPAAYRPLYDATLDGLKSQVDAATWAAWWTEGKALPLDEVCSLALAASEGAEL
ncbi:MAG: hypothetical protein NVS2B12_22860 [Ktedonobacteraceae bacterium]